MKRIIVLVWLLTVVAANCSGTATRTDNGGREFERLTFKEPIIVTYSPQVLKENRKTFVLEEQSLVEAVRQALAPQGLITSDGTATLELSLKTASFRNEGVAVKWGFLAGGDSLEVDVIIRAEDGVLLGQFALSLDYYSSGVYNYGRRKWFNKKIAELVLEAMQPRTEP